MGDHLFPHSVRAVSDHLPPSGCVATGLPAALRGAIQAIDKTLLPQGGGGMFKQKLFARGGSWLARSCHWRSCLPRRRPRNPVVVTSMARSTVRPSKQTCLPMPELRSEVGSWTRRPPRAPALRGAVQPGHSPRRATGSRPSNTGTAVPRLGLDRRAAVGPAQRISVRLGCRSRDPG